jgi:SAM-dependent methyltransferase
MELTVHFYDQSEWLAWRKEHYSSFDRWRNAVLNDVNEIGYFEPLIGTQVTPGEFTVSKSLRESIAHRQINSRKRAMLLEIDRLGKEGPPHSGISTRIFAPEARSRIARFFAENFSGFRGSEYMPDPDTRCRFPDVTHVDLQNMPFDSGTFDLVFSGEVLEHVADLDRCLIEMARVLTSTGRMVATIPFRYNDHESIVCATVEPDGTVRHLREPIYHADPMNPKGALVFTLPGWDILDRCRKAGFADAAMTMHVSSRFGIAADDLPGVILLTAWKGGHAREPVRAPFDAGMINRIAGIAGLPRSGTTVLTAFLAAHSAVSAEFEPWNSRIEHFCHDDPDILRIVPHLKSHQKSSRCLLIKETTTRLEYLRNLTTLLDSVPYPVQEDLVVINRNLQHVFLSEVQGRRDWWGESSLAVTQPVFDEWAKRSLQSLQMLMSVALERNAWMIRYDALTADPAIVGGILESWQLGFESAQFEFHKSLDMRQVRGDQSIVRVPRPISAASGLRRESELQSIESQIAGSPFRERIEVIGAILDSLPGLARAGDCRTALAEILRQTGGA